jgi:hypothetical protein
MRGHVQVTTCLQNDGTVTYKETELTNCTFPSKQRSHTQFAVTATFTHSPLVSCVGALPTWSTRQVVSPECELAHQVWHVFVTVLFCKCMHTIESSTLPHHAKFDNSSPCQAWQILTVLSSTLPHQDWHFLTMLTSTLPHRVKLDTSSPY